MLIFFNIRLNFAEAISIFAILFFELQLFKKL